MPDSQVTDNAETGAPPRSILSDHSGHTDEELDRAADAIVAGIYDRARRVRAGRLAFDALTAVRDGKRLPSWMTEPHS